MTALTHGMQAFSHRNYRLFFGGQAISLIGTWMQQVAQAWLVLELTHDPLWLGVVAAAQFIPILLFGLFAGVLAVAGEPLLVSTHDAGGCIQQPFAAWIVASPADERADRRDVAQPKPTAAKHAVAQV